MFCPECGKKLPDDSKFCVRCGKKLIDISDENYEEEETEDFDELEFVPEIPDDDVIEPKKKGGSKIIIGIVLAALIVGAAGFGLKAYFSGKNEEDSSSIVSDEESQSTESQSEDSAAELSEEPSSETASIVADIDEEDTAETEENAFIYLSNNCYELTTDLDEDNPIEIAANAGDWEWQLTGPTVHSLLTASPDGKYVYYFVDWDEGNFTGTLCRVECSENENNIETIAAGVSYSDLDFLDDNSVVFKDANETLYYFDGEESVKIAGDVDNFYTDGTDKILYFTRDHDTGYTLYGVSTSDIDHKIILSSNMSFRSYGYGVLGNCTDYENILYFEEEEDGTETLYVTGFEKETERLAEDVNYYTLLNDKLYFTALNGETLNLDGNDSPVCTLYCLENGNLTTINEDVLEFGSCYLDSGLFYSTESEKYILLADGTSCRMSASAAKTYAEANNDETTASLYCTAKEVYLIEWGDGNPIFATLSMASIEDGVVGDFSVITDEDDYLFFDDSTLYYYISDENADYTDSSSSADLYSCSSGTSTLLAEDVVMTDKAVNLYSDGVILAYTDCTVDSDYVYRYELTMIDSDGEATIIGDNVTQYIRIDESTVLYISDGDLYVYNGTESKKLKSDVDKIWSKNSAEIDMTLDYWRMG